MSSACGGTGSTVTGSFHPLAGCHGCLLQYVLVSSIQISSTPPLWMGLMPSNCISFAQIPNWIEMLLYLNSESEVPLKSLLCSLFSI